tara:strand:+ start:1239 stop:1688 length:450 start_codon:yes stop_codon:yes gene_type:complete
MLILPAVAAAGALPVGDSNVSISVGNRRREFGVYVPSDEARRNPSGLVVVLHGFNQKAQWACDVMGRSSAQRHGFVVACPQGASVGHMHETGWNTNIQARPLTRRARALALALANMNMTRAVLFLTNHACLDKQCARPCIISAGHGQKL